MFALTQRGDHVVDECNGIALYCPCAAVSSVFNLYSKLPYQRVVGRFKCENIYCHCKCGVNICCLKVMKWGGNKKKINRWWNNSGTLFGLYLLLVGGEGGVWHHKTLSEVPGLSYTCPCLARHLHIRITCESHVTTLRNCFRRKMKYHCPLALLFLPVYIYLL